MWRRVAADGGLQLVVAFAPSGVAQRPPLVRSPGRRAQRVVGVGEKGFFRGIAQQLHRHGVYLREPALHHVINTHKLPGVSVEQVGEGGSVGSGERGRAQEKNGVLG